MNSSKKLILLQVFRGFASLYVLLFHANAIFNEKLNYNFVYGIFKLGNTGVDFFFVLSGFIIYYIHHKDIENTSKFKNYLIRRFIRIYPIYWIFLVIVTPVYFIIPSFGVGYERDFGTIIKSFFLIPQSHSTIIVSAWTLSYEVLFYLMFGILIKFKKVYSYSLIFIWLLLSACKNLFFSNLFYSPEKFFIDFVFSEFNFEFLVGCIIAYLVVNKVVTKYGIQMIITGLLFAIFSSISYNYSLNIFGDFIQFIIPFGIIIMGAAVTDISGKFKNTVPLLLVLVGDASYSIYLTHQILLSFILKIIKAININVYIGNFVTFVLAVVFAVLIGVLIHIFIEKKCLKYLLKRIEKRNF